MFLNLMIGTMSNTLNKVLANKDRQSSLSKLKMYRRHIHLLDRFYSIRCCKKQKEDNDPLKQRYVFVVNPTNISDTELVNSESTTF